MTPLEITLVSTIIPFLVALTAWLRAEVATRTAKAAKITASSSGVTAALAIARTNRLVPPAFPQGGVPVRPDLGPDNPDKNN